MRLGFHAFKFVLIVGSKNIILISNACLCVCELLVDGCTDFDQLCINVPSGLSIADKKNLSFYWNVAHPDSPIASPPLGMHHQTSAILDEA